ncbi:MAG TPA: N-acetylmuramoyl-L-alanine amidase, partial [Treponemataceae bacterium]|nr:N-acetylmuramoyl-L-alanine amidase [Treponemataceae bacterium]
MKKTRVFYCVLIVLTTLAYAQSSMPDEMISLVRVAEKTDSTLYWDGMRGAGVLEKNGHHVSFSAFSEYILFDYHIMKKCEAVKKTNGTFYANNSFLSIVKNFFDSVPPETHYRIGAILIDAGHGGKDPGAVSNHIINGKKVTIHEKDLALTVAKKLHAMLLSIYPDKKIILTRESDIFLSLSERTEQANTVEIADNEAILFVSIHANSAFNKTAKGFEVWYLSPGYRRQVVSLPKADKELEPILNSMMEEEFTTESILIAKYINDGLEKQIGSMMPSRGIKEEEWFVCKHANMPSVLVEMGFISNAEEAALLIDDGYLRKISLGIYNGLTAFVTHFETSRGFTGIP